MGAPDVLSISQLDQEQSGNIDIKYVLADDQGDSVNLICQYSDNSGSQWNLASVSGTTANISSPDYTGSIIWQSNNDLPGVDKTRVRFKITQTMVMPEQH